MLLDSTYIDEEFAIRMESGSITMRSTLGVDGRTNELRLIALDKEYSTMDVYAGTATGRTLVLSNLKTDVAFKSADGTQFSFRLTLEPCKSCHHQLTVEYTNDNGQTWKRFSRQEYFLKK
ncbi:MAG: hypothetical protein ABJF11_06615 [Reichenbachiella sp.]|uniref:hypothetical protein n=1 Tax=Reichenbachiella sp. TaxID=2184521 RepID=UPI00326405C5